MIANIHFDNDDEILEKWCEEEEVDYQLASKLKARIFPLLEVARKRLGYRFDKAFLEQRKGTEIRLANSKTIMLLLARLKPRFFSIKEQRVITLHLEFLTLVEGFLVTQINFLIFILIANGHDLYPTRKEKDVKTLGDIEKENLAFKLKFLGKHGFRKLIANKARNLRNGVAHLFYEIDEKGTIKVGRERIREDDYGKLYDDLRNISHSLHLVSRLYYRRYASIKPAKFAKIKCRCGYVNLIPIIRTSRWYEPIECTNCGKVIAEPKELIRIES